jgi:hypothetical protein
MASTKDNLSDSRQQAQWDKAEYEAKTKGLAFTKDFLSRQEALMRDPMATVGERVMAWILRRSWGEFRLYAIKSDGEAAFQVDCARELGIGKRRVSAAVSYYQKRGYLETHPKKLYPIISPALASPQKVPYSPDFLQFMEEWKVAYSSDFEEEKVLSSRLKEIRKVRLSLYKKSKTPAQSGGASLCIESKKIKEESPSSSSAVQSLPLPEQKAEEEEPSLYQRFKSTYPASHFDEAKAKPSFDGKTKAQQALILDRLLIYLSCENWLDDGGRWIPLASNWLKSYEADPPPLLKRQTVAKGSRRAAADAFFAEDQS